MVALKPLIEMAAMSMPKSNISLNAASQAFVDNRKTTLGPWVIGAFFDTLLLGVVLTQVASYFKLRRSGAGGAHYWYTWLVILVTFLSILKSVQAICVVWVQNVLDFANPDAARKLSYDAWWQVPVPLMTAVIGVVVQSFFAHRFWMLTRSWLCTIPICTAMALGITGAALSVVNIVNGNAKMKVMWLLVHLVSVFLADFMITLGTYVALKRSTSGFPATASLVNRLLRMVFESALPPTILATFDLILTQTLGADLLWHLVLNYPLSKLYVISLLYTLNSIGEYRRRNIVSQQYALKDPTRPDVELTTRSVGIHVHTQVLTRHDSDDGVSPTSATEKDLSPSDTSFRSYAY